MPPRPSFHALVTRGKLLFDWTERTNPNGLRGLLFDGAKGSNTNVLLSLLFDGAKRPNTNVLLGNNRAKGTNRSASASVQDAGGRAITTVPFSTTLGSRIAGASPALSRGACAATLAASLRGERAAITTLSVTLSGRRPGLARALPAGGTPGSGRIPAARSFAVAGV
jgi:hypothetical protein